MQKTYLINLTFTEPLLGTANCDPDIHETHVAGKILDAKNRLDLTKAEKTDLIAEEKALLEHQAEADLSKQKTIFPKLASGTPILWDYQLRGFFKEAIRCCLENGTVPCTQGETKVCSPSSVQEAVDRRLFVDRTIPLRDPAGEKWTPDTLNRADWGDLPYLVKRTAGQVPTFTRPLRAMTMQGPRVCLATSEILPAGTRATFTVTLFTGTPIGAKKNPNRITEDMLLAALDWGRWVGIGQWRSGSFGRFTYLLE